MTDTGPCAFCGRTWPVNSASRDGTRSTAVKVCSEHGCPRLQAESKCPEHRRADERKRGTRQARGYGARHDAIRAGIQDRMNAGERFRCWRCGVTLDPNAWHLGHDDHDRSRYRGPECVTCNTATSGRR